MKKRTIKLAGDWDLKVVFLDDQLLDPKYSQTVYNHSPDGFNWGYSGSGPAQLALAICLELYGRQKAIRVYQHFKAQFISPLPQNHFKIELDITEYEGYEDLTQFFDNFKSNLLMSKVTKPMDHIIEAMDVIKKEQPKRTMPDPLKENCVKTNVHYLETSDLRMLLEASEASGQNIMIKRSGTGLSIIGY